MKYLYATAFIILSSYVSAAPNNHLNEFVRLFDDYCYSFKDKPNLTHSHLKKMGHKYIAEYEAYEILIDDIDYAVTPQKKDCTTDVLLKHKNRTLFNLEQIEPQLLKKFQLTPVSNRSFQDVALNNQNTLILQRDYQDDDGRKYRLLYPSDNQDSYYMTFTIQWLEA